MGVDTSISILGDPKRYMSSQSGKGSETSICREFSPTDDDLSESAQARANCTCFSNVSRNATLTASGLGKPERQATKQLTHRPIDKGGAVPKVIVAIGASSIDEAINC